MRILGTVATVLALTITALVLVTSAGASLNTRLAAVVKAPRVPAGGTRLGAPTASSGQSGYVVLKPRDASALTQFITSVSTRGSREYHHFLSAAQFRATYGPTRSTISAVETQLKHDGLTVSSVAKDGLLVGFKGSTTKVESAFHTSLERYRTQAGTTGQLATGAVQLPASIASQVSSVVGLDTLIHPEADLVHPPKSAYGGHAAAKTGAIHRTDAGSGAPSACADATSDAQEFGGLTDDQIANAYGAFGEYDAGDTAQGVSIGVYELEPFSASDLQTFDECYFGTTAGDAMAAAVQVHQVDGGLPAGPGSGESILDIEDVSAIAPGAHLDVYEAPNTTAGGIDEYAQMVDDDQDKIITSSWGECEQDIELYSPGIQQAENDIFEQAAAQGQTVLSAAGDTGDDTCNEIRSTPQPADQNPLSVNDPSSQPYVLAVGGTTINDADPANYDEAAWNDGAQWGGGGGGLSATWGAPSWQPLTAGFPTPGGTDYTNANYVEQHAESLGISSQAWPADFCANNTNLDPSGAPIDCRALPDVSAQADEFTGAITMYQAVDGGWFTIGGTSSATPIWAGLLALVDASPACQQAGVTAAQGIGFANPLLYAVADSASYLTDFHDITTGNNDVYGMDDGKVFPAHAGFDLATGLGSPVLVDPAGTGGLADDLCDMAGDTSTAPTVTGVSSSASSQVPYGPVSGGGSLTITGTNFQPAGESVAAVTIGGDRVPANDISVSADGTTITVTPIPSGATSLATPTTTSTGAGGNGYESGGATGTQDGSGPADVVVTMSNGQSSQIGPNSVYSYVDETSSHPTPSVSSISPYAGLEAGGTSITVYGSGFTSGDTVTIGGLSAGNVQVVSPWELTAVTPQFQSGQTATKANPAPNSDCTTAAALTAETAALGENGGKGDTNPASDDICQTDVVVTDSQHHVSRTDSPLPAYEGAAPVTNDDGVPEVPAGYELSPQPTEYDYVPTPVITGVTDADGNAFSASDPSGLADSLGGTDAIVTGEGLNDLTLDWFNVGDPGQYSSVIPTVLYTTGTTAVLALPASASTQSTGTPSADPESDPVSVRTLGAQAGPGPDVTFSGLPQITSVSTGASDEGLAAASDQGGTPLTIDGVGFSDLDGPLEYNDISKLPNGVPASTATQYQYTVASDTEITTTTLAQNPGVLDTRACTTSGCSTPSSTTPGDTDDEVLAYPPGNPVITGIDTTSGPAEGGTAVTISGENLGCVTSVTFGSTPVEAVSPTTAILDCGATDSLTVMAPAGTAGTAGQSVAIALTTVESDVTGAAPAVSPQQFTYTANPPSPSSGSTTTVTQTVTTAGPTTTVTLPGTTTTVISAAPAVTITKTIECDVSTVEKLETVKVKVKVKVHGKTKVETKREKKRVRVKVKKCHTVSTTQSERIAQARAKAAAETAARRAAAKAEASAAAKARAATRATTRTPTKRA